jgi:translation initiation factor 4G
MVREATDLKIVDAREEHVPFLAWVQLTAFRSHLPRGMWDLFLDGPEGDCLRFLEAFAVTDTRHWGHYANFIVAEVDGTPAAALTGYFVAESGGPAFLEGVREASRAIGRTEADDAAGWERAGSITRLSLEHAPGAWIVENVATRPEFRRRGLVDRLLAEILERGRDRGASVAEIGVFIGNDPAQRAYEKAGFAVVQEVRDAEFEAAYGCPGARELRRAI